MASSWHVSTVTLQEKQREGYTSSSVSRSSRDTWNISKIHMQITCNEDLCVACIKNLAYLYFRNSSGFNDLGYTCARALIHPQSYNIILLNSCQILIRTWVLSVIVIRVRVLLHRRNLFPARSLLGKICIGSVIRWLWNVWYMLYVHIYV